MSYRTHAGNMDASSAPRAPAWQIREYANAPSGQRPALLIGFGSRIDNSRDTLRLRDGSTVTGNFLGATADDIRFSVNGEVQHYARANVARIDFSRHRSIRLRSFPSPTGSCVAPIT